MKKKNPTPLKLVRLVCWARLVAFPTSSTSKRGHQQNHLDCSHGCDLKRLISFEWAFVINYYKSISRFIRKCVFSRAKSFPYDFLRILSLASSGFPSNWGVKNTSEITFFPAKKWGCVQDEKWLGSKRPRRKKQIRTWICVLFFVLGLEKNKTKHMAQLWREK